METINEYLSNYLLVFVLLVAAVWFTVATGGVQFGMFGEMWRLLVRSGRKYDEHPEAGRDQTVSSFQAFMISLASRVGTGNLAGVATAIALGGPGAVFWMWVIAVLGAATAFVESTLAQIFKVRGNGAFLGGPAYYILKGTGRRWWAVLFAVLITVTFGLAFNSVQANTIAEAMENSFGFDRIATGIGLTVLTSVIIWGGIQSIARFSAVVVPVMAVGYILLAVLVIVINFDRIPAVFGMIFDSAFGFEQALGGGLGMAVIMGVKRGLFSNEAGEGSTPNAAATADVTHPVKQGLIQALGVYTDTLILCTCTAFIILCSGVLVSPEAQGADGIVLTQYAIDGALGAPGYGSLFVSVAIFFFAFTSIVANYYYGESNLLFIRHSRMMIRVYRLIVGGMVFIGSVASLKFVWSLADITMALMTFCNIAAIVVLGKYAVMALRDYRGQLRNGLDPHFRRSTLPEIADKTECWPD
nr:alanine:cation symporter family protein [uncultured bacterium]